MNTVSREMKTVSRANDKEDCKLMLVCENSAMHDLLPPATKVASTSIRHAGAQPAAGPPFFFVTCADVSSRQRAEGIEQGSVQKYLRRKQHADPRQDAAETRTV